MKILHFESLNSEFKNILNSRDDEYYIAEYIGLFNSDLSNQTLEFFNKLDRNITLWTDYIFDDNIKLKYQNINFKFDIITASTPTLTLIQWFDGPRNQNLNIRNFGNASNFICCFNGASNQSRQILTAALFKANWYKPEYCSKNFGYTTDSLDGNIRLLSDSALKEKFYRTVLIDRSSIAENFYNTPNGFSYDSYDKLNLKNNLNALNQKIISSFVHLVSETSAHSYIPVVSEKSAVPIRCKSLWVAYAPVGHHRYIEKYYGFKLYENIFNYSFDTISHPIDRLLELLSMLSKFEKLSTADWHDLWLLEEDTIKFNYNHYMSGSYYQHLKKYAY